MRRIAAIALSLTLLATACSDDADDAVATTEDELALPELEGVDLGSDILAKVGDATLTESDAYEFVDDDGTGVIDRTLLTGDVQLWAILEAVEQEMTKRGATLTPIDESLEGSAALEARGNALGGDLEALAVAETEDATQSSEPPVVFCVSRILVETEAEAVDLIEQLETGADFAELSQVSIDGSGANGGDVGCYAAGQTGVPEIEEAVFASGAPGLVGPIQTDQGFDVLDVRSIGPATAEFHPDDAEAVAAIPTPAQTAQEEVVGAYVNELIATAFAMITVDDSLGVFDPLAGGIVPVSG